MIYYKNIRDFRELCRAFESHYGVIIHESLNIEVWFCLRYTLPTMKANIFVNV